MVFAVIIKARVNATPLFTAEIDAKYESASPAVQLGEAIKKAVSAKADLGGADLGGADLRGADLGGADLRGADLGDSLKASGRRPVFQLGPVGKYAEYISAFITAAGPHVRTAEFTGPLAEFRARMLAPQHRNGDTLVWLAAIQMIEAHACAYPPMKES